MKLSSVSLEQVLEARERRVEIQNKMLAGADQGQCMVCLTLNIAGEIKRTPKTRMLFLRGTREFDSLGFKVAGRYMLDEVTGSEAFWLLDEDAAEVKRYLEEVEDAFPAARLYDFDVLTADGAKLSRNVSRRCLICDAPAAECARSRRHGLDAIKAATDSLLRQFCSEELACAAYDSLLDELYTTPKPGLVDRNNCGAHTDMDIPLLEKSAESLIPFFRDAVLMGMDRCNMSALRARGIEAEKTMFEVTEGVNTHKGMVYSMGLILAGMGISLSEGGSCIENAAALARQDSEIQLERSLAGPDTNGGAVYSKYGARGASGEAADGFPDALYCCERLAFYRSLGCEEPAALAFCDSMARLEDTNLLHRGGAEGLAYARMAASEISSMPIAERIDALQELDRAMTERWLSPGGSADMLALAFLLERWRAFE